MNDMPKSLIEPREASLGAVAQTSRLTLDNLQKLSTLQMDALRTYLGLGLGFARLRAAADVKDEQGLLAFQAGQAKASESLSEKPINDGKALTELGARLMAVRSRLAEDVGDRSTNPLQAHRST